MALDLLMFFVVRYHSSQPNIVRRVARDREIASHSLSLLIPLSSFPSLVASVPIGPRPDAGPMHPLSAPLWPLGVAQIP